jgi:hypothetical protein
MAGYSGTPLVQKLGIKPDHCIALIDSPEGFDRTLGALPVGVSVSDNARGGEPLDVIVFFTTSATKLRQRFASLARRLAPAGGFWVAWPKRASGVATDLTEDVVRAIALEAGLVDNKVCAIDEVWSGLRLVIRVKDRPKGGRRR